MSDNTPGDRKCTGCHLGPLDGRVTFWKLLVQRVLGSAETVLREDHRYPSSQHAHMHSRLWEARGPALSHLATPCMAPSLPISGHILAA